MCLSFLKLTLVQLFNDKIDKCRINKLQLVAQDRMFSLRSLATVVFLVALHNVQGGPPSNGVLEKLGIIDSELKVSALLLLPGSQSHF